MKRLLVLLFVFVAACSQPKGPTINQVTPLQKARGCVQIEVNVCTDDVKGVVTNNCGADIGYILLNADGKDANGKVLDSDIEYVMDLADGDSVHFNALLDYKLVDDLKSCYVRIEEAEFK